MKILVPIELNVGNPNHDELGRFASVNIHESVDNPSGHSSESESLRDNGKGVIFWGKTAAGVLPISADTGKICLALRSSSVHSLINGKTAHAQCWGTFGGSFDQKEISAEEAAKNELGEESGYRGPIEMHPAYKFQSGTFQYHNHLGVVPHESDLALNPESGNSWETDDVKWFSLDEILKSKGKLGGYPMHDGLRDLLRESKSQIEALVKKHGKALSLSILALANPNHDEHGRFATVQGEKREANFQKWFKGANQCCKNPDGSPKVFYHGAPLHKAKSEGNPIRTLGDMGDEHAFDRNAAAKFLGYTPDVGMDRVGSWFSDVPGEHGAGMYSGDEGVVYPVYLCIKHPWIVSFDGFIKKGQELDDWEKKNKAEKKHGGFGLAAGRFNVGPLREWMKKKKFDGIQFVGKVDHPDQHVLVALEPEQIKSATGNVGTFSKKNKDIRASLDVPLELANKNHDAKGRFTSVDASDEEAIQERAENYFGVGHGDEDVPFKVWALIDDNVEASPEYKGESDGETHGSLWGHDVTNRSFKGRYETTTGRLTVVVPDAMRKHKEDKEIEDQVNYDLLPRLKKKLGKINEVMIFSSDIPIELNIGNPNHDEVGRFAPKGQTKDEQIHSKAFKAWFGDWQDPHAYSSLKDPNTPPVSMAINKDHTPKVFYHGTHNSFSEFNPEAVGRNINNFGTYEVTRHGFFFTADAKSAGQFAIQGDENDRTKPGVGVKGSVIKPVYLKIAYPARMEDGISKDLCEELATEGVTCYPTTDVDKIWEVFDDDNGGKEFVSALKRLGYDGAVIKEMSPDREREMKTWVAFDPEQIKSATGNSGKFDKHNKDIRASLDIAIELSVGNPNHDEKGKFTTVYHVTMTDNVPLIKKNGIETKHKQNWYKASGGVYGNGEVYAFTNPADAVRWASSMDWAKNKDMGTGKISIVKFKARNKEGWKEDTNDPASHIGSKGKWIKRTRAVKPEDIIGSVPVTIEHMRAASAGKPIELSVGNPNHDELGRFSAGNARLSPDGDSGSGIDKVGRSRRNPSQEFPKPIVGPSGASLSGYNWRYYVEEYVDEMGEERKKRVSNWDESETNEHTGREVVHQFTVNVPEQGNKIVSLESALTLLGYTKGEKTPGVSNIKKIGTAVKNQAKTELELAIHKDAFGRIDKAMVEAKKTGTDVPPEIKAEAKSLGYDAPDPKYWDMYQRSYYLRDNAKLEKKAADLGEHVKFLAEEAANAASGKGPGRYRDDAKKLDDLVMEIRESVHGGYHQASNITSAISETLKQHGVTTNQQMTEDAKDLMGTLKQYYKMTGRTNYGERTSKTIIPHAIPETKAFGSKIPEVPASNDKKMEKWYQEHRAEIQPVVEKLEAWLNQYKRPLMKAKKLSLDFEIELSNENHDDKGRFASSAGIKPLEADEADKEWDRMLAEQKRRLDDMDTSAKPWCEREMVKVDDGLSLMGFSGFTKEQKQQYRDSAESVLSRMNAHTLAVFDNHVNQFIFYKSCADISDTAGKTDNELGKYLSEHPELQVAGFYDPGKKSLNLDGLTLVKEPTPVDQVYAHEFYHGVDGPDDNFSRDRRWRGAWSAEIREKLSMVAQQSASEGFAEFGRYVMTCDTNDKRVEAWKNYPSGMAFFYSMDLLPKAFGASPKTPQSPNPMRYSLEQGVYDMPEVFSGSLQTKKGKYDFQLKPAKEVLLELANTNHDEKGRFASGSSETITNINTTDDPRKAGFVRTDGKLVDCTGGENYRGVEHVEVFGGKEHLMQEELARGTIRWNPEHAGMELHKEPTDEQYDAIELLAASAGRNPVSAELSVGLGKKTIYKDGKAFYDQPTLYSFKSWKAGTRPEKIVNDIRAWYANPKSEWELSNDAHDELGRFATKSGVERDSNFKKWFAGSKIVDKSGKPLVVYHGTSAVDFHKFKLRPGDVGIHFGTIGQANDRIEYKTIKSKTPDANERLYPVYLAIKNPFRMDDCGLWNATNMKYRLLEAFPNDEAKIGSEFGNNGLKNSSQIRKFLQSKGYDGIVYRNSAEVTGGAEYAKRQDALWEVLQKAQLKRGKSINSMDTEDQKTPEYKAFSAARQAYEEYRKKNAEDSYIAFSPEQIKSATGNVGTYNPKNKDIRASLTVPIELSWKKHKKHKPMPQYDLKRMALLHAMADKIVACRNAGVDRSDIYRQIASAFNATSISFLTDAEKAELKRLGASEDIEASLQLSNDKHDKLGKFAPKESDMTDEDRRIKAIMDDWNSTAESARNEDNLIEEASMTQDKLLEEARDSVIADFRKDPDGKQPWSVVPFARVQKIWNDYAKTGVVRDEKGIDMIAGKMIDNTMKLYANTQLAGHTDDGLGSRDFGITEEEDDKLTYWLEDTKEQQLRISDYGLQPLADYAFNLLMAKTPESKLQIIDKMLNVTHPRSDLASWFIEGGQKSLSKLAGNDVKASLGMLELNNPNHDELGRFDTKDSMHDKLKEALDKIKNETPEEKVERDRSVKASNDAINKVMDKLKQGVFINEDTYAPGQKEAYLAAAQQVLGFMPNQAIEKLNTNLDTAVFFQNTDDLTKMLQTISSKDYDNKIVGGAWVNAGPRQGELMTQGKLMLDGGGELGDKYPDTTREVYAHEFSHAIDYLNSPGKGIASRISSTWNWISAWDDEINTGYEPLSKYARKDATEGFAEFGRLCYTNPKQAKELFPRCWNIWVDRGLVGGKKVAEPVKNSWES